MLQPCEMLLEKIKCRLKRRVYKVISAGVIKAPVILLKIIISETIFFPH